MDEPSTYPPPNGVRKGAPAAAKNLPTNRMELETQIAILCAYARLSSDRRPVDSERIAGAVAITAEAASLTEGFFVDSGWLEHVGRDRYVATEAAVAYQRRTEGGFSSEAVTLLAAAARSSWYWEALSHSLDDGHRLSYYDALVVLATSANSAEEDRPKLDVLLQWMAFLGMIEIDGDHIAGAESPGRAEGSDLSITVSTDLRFTSADLAELTPDEIRRLFEAIGIAASLIQRRR